MCTRPAIIIMLAALATCSFSQLICNGILSSPNPVTSDVSVPGGLCIVQGITITGSVEVTSSGTLTTRGNTEIQGSVTATRSGSVFLGGSTSVSGDVSFDSRSKLTLNSNTVVTSISLFNGAVFEGRGTSGEITAENARDILLRNATITGGGIGVQGGSGSLTLCGSKISGGIGFVEVEGDLISVSGSNCEENEIIGSVKVEKGKGKVDIIGSTLTGGDIEVVEQTGDITFKDAAMSDINMDTVAGNVLLEDIQADSDGTITGTVGSVTLKNSDVMGDFAIEGTQGNVTVENNDFSMESFAVIGSTGRVTVRGNTDLSANLEENAGVVFSNNKGEVAEISKNTVSTAINNNELTTLSCSDNTPEPSGNGNQLGTATGQCVGF